MNSLNIDITTGHVILAYIEKNLNDKELLNKDWNYLSEYEADFKSTYTANLEKNMRKNRYQNIIPYDHSLVKLSDSNEDNYINANFIIDDDPKNPAYIATQSPLLNTIKDFWRMVWENQAIVIVNLGNIYGSEEFIEYWPTNGYQVYENFEVHFASEHSWNTDYLVRNLYFKNLTTNQTRTITQFHFLNWPEYQIPPLKSILEFRKIVNKSFTSKNCPIIVHCDDGVGRTGTYILIDMIINKISRGAKEIDLAATVEFLRDQRPEMIKYKFQYEFSFEAIIDEVKNMLNSR